MKETIFFATFKIIENSTNGECSRYSSFKGEKSLDDFTNWLEEQIDIMKSEGYTKVMTTHINIIKSGY